MQAIIALLTRILAQLQGLGTGLSPFSLDKITRVLAFSTTAVLGNAGVYTSPTFDALNYKTYSTLVTSDQAGSYFTQYSDDGVTWQNAAATAIASAANAITLGAGIVLILRYQRFVYTNGATPQGSFKFSCYMSPL